MATQSLHSLAASRRTSALNLIAVVGSVSLKIYSDLGLSVQIVSLPVVVNTKSAVQSAAERAMEMPAFQAAPTVLIALNVALLMSEEQPMDPERFAALEACNLVIVAAFTAELLINISCASLLTKYIRSITTT